MATRDRHPASELGDWSFLPVAVRAWSEPNQAAGYRPEREPSLPDHVLVFDTETTIDETQALNFGAWRFYRATSNGAALDLTCVDEGLFFADDLPERDLEGYETLRAYRAGHGPDVDPTVPDASFQLRLVSQRQFVDEVLLKAAFELRAWVVGFNLPFDLSRVAYGSGYARVSKKRKTPDTFEGGFTMPMAMYRTGEGELKERSLYRPRVAIKTIDSKRHLIGLRRPSEVDEVHLLPDPDPNATPGSSTRKGFQNGNFLDLRTLAFALTDESYSLKRACKDFGVEAGKHETEEHGIINPSYIDYNRRDVEATAELFTKLMAEYRLHGLDLPATHAYSPASLGKAYLRRMGIRPVLDRQPNFDRDVLGYSMAAYFGGRTECRIRRSELPVVYCDFLSMYPTVNSLMGLWGLLTADSIEVAEATSDVETLLDDITFDDCFDPTVWRQLPVLVEVEPDGDILPLRAGYAETGNGWQIGVNPVRSDRPLWYALPDVVASKILTGHGPQILRALRLVPSGGKARGLNSVELRGETNVDPKIQDLFRTVIEERKSLPDSLDETTRKRLDRALKILANATSYGIFAEIVRNELGGDRTATTTPYGLSGRFPKPIETKAVEQPGEYSFPPLAACITAAARLMLALAEAAVTQQGGTYVFCDTDSIAIVATEHGGFLPCGGGPHATDDGQAAVKTLSWSEVEAIRTRFDQLHPYDRAKVPGSILELEKQNFRDENRRTERSQLYCYAVSAKRYILYNRGPGDDVTIRKASQHGLGHLLNPTDPDSDDRDWIEAVWRHILSSDRGDNPTPPDWFNRPAIGRITVSSPVLHRPFRRINAERSYAEQVKPFNFMLTAHIDEPWKRPTDVAANDPFQLVAPWDSDPSQWRNREWINRYDPARTTYQITTEGDTGRPGLAVVSTYANTVGRYAIHPEPKSIDIDGKPASGRQSVLLRRRPVFVTTLTYIGKEANSLDEVDAGLHHNIDDVLTQHDDPDKDFWTETVIPVMETFSLNEIAAASDVDRSTVSRTRNAKTRPHPDNESKLLNGLARLCTERLKDLGIRPPRDMRSALFAAAMVDDELFSSTS